MDTYDSIKSLAFRETRGLVLDGVSNITQQYLDLVKLDYNYLLQIFYDS